VETESTVQTLQFKIKINTKMCVAHLQLQVGCVVGYVALAAKPIHFVKS
jgi:hypothetical protein